MEGWRRSHSCGSKKFTGVLAYFPGFPAACCFAGFDTRGNFSLLAEILAFDVSAPR